MKKRIACLLLALVMLVGLIPATAIRASAADLSVSEAGIRVIKQHVGFHKNAYATSSGWRIGYGTPSVEGATITEGNANALLRETLGEIAKKLNDLLPGKILLQQRMDALVWYSYLEGTGWASGSALATAVSNSITGSDFVDAMLTWDCQQGFAQWVNQSDIDLFLRRLRMANLYLTGAYDANATGTLSFTIFDAGEGATCGAGTKKVMVQGYDYARATNFCSRVATPVNGTKQFLGWYLNGNLMTSLNGATTVMVLEARWSNAGTAAAAGYPLCTDVVFMTLAQGDPSYQNKLELDVHASASDSSAVIDHVYRQAIVTVVAELVDTSSVKWVQLSTGGWLKLGKVTDMPASIPAKVVTITDDYVNIRENPSATAGKLAVAKRGEQRTITMLSADGRWGYCYQGWIFLAYTDYDGKTGPASSTGTTTVAGTPGTVTGAARVNVRKGPGVGNALATTLAEGTAVTVYEQTTADGAPWGRIDQGWISMGYVKLQQVQKPTDGSNIGTGSTAVVSSSVRLNVRSGPGTNYSKVATLAPGTSVVILRKETVGGATWGLIDQGWINMSYVTATGSSSNGGSVYSVGGTVVNCSTGVNIRAAAGVTNALIGVAGVGTRVNVTEIVVVNGYNWGHIERGWVCMDYIQLDSEFKKPEPTVPNTVEDEPDNVVSSFEGYPANVINTSGAPLRATASADSKVLLTLNTGATVNILAWTKTGTNLYGKVTVGDKTGWVNMVDVTMKAFNGKVTAGKSNVYEEASTRSKFYAALTNSTYITVPEGNDNWKLSDGVLWGKIESVSGVPSGWIQMSTVSMFKDNKLPTGITSYNGAGYLLGTLITDSTVYLDDNGSVSTQTSLYTLPLGSRVNIQARNYQPDTDVTYGKVTVGSVTGWIDMGDVDLDLMTVVASTLITVMKESDSSIIEVPAGTRFTVALRELRPNPFEINHGVADLGYGYMNDNTSEMYYFVLDDGKLKPTTAAAVTDPSNPVIASSVVVTGSAPSGLTVYEEAMDTSRELLKLNAGAQVTILNWKNVGGETWGKVQINKIVGWVQASKVSFSGLTGVVNVEELKLYSYCDKTSSVQVLRMNNKQIQIDTLYFDDTILWGYTNVAGYPGWIDLSQVKLNTPGITEGTDLTTLPVMAKGKVNSVNATVNINGEVKSLPKGTEVSLIDLKIESGKAKWLVELGDMDGWIDMDCVSMYSAIATIATSSSPIYNDLNLIADDILYTLYRDEKVTVQSFFVQGGKLYGEVAYGDTTGWILLHDGTNRCVNLVPGSTGTTIGGGNGGNGSATTPTTPTTPAADPIPAYIVCNTTVNVRSGAGVGNPLVTTLPNGTNVKIYEKAVELGKEWARIDQGWVCMDYVRLGTQATVPNGGNNGGSGTVTIITTVPGGAIAVGYANQDINIRAGSGLGYPETGSVKKGQSVTIYENKLDGGMSWGRTDAGWVCTSYLTITGIGAAGSGNMGTIGGVGFTANVRGTANSNGALMAKVMVSSRVVVRETTVVGAETWGRTDLGWINMQYIVMDSAAAPAPTVPDATTPTETTPAETTDDSVG